MQPFQESTGDVHDQHAHRDGFREVPLDAPARAVAQMWKQRADAGNGFRIAKDELGLAVLAGNGISALDFQDFNRATSFYAAVILAVVATTFLASVIPARRAARVDPVVALRL